MTECKTHWTKLACLTLSLLAAACTVATEGDGPSISTVRQAVTCLTDPESEVTLYVATDGDDSGSGTCNEPFASLEGAHAYIDAQDPNVDGQRINSRSYTVYVRGGTYERQTVVWRVASPDHRITITGYPGEEAIFDGKGDMRLAIEVKIDRGEQTPITISHLTFRHYVSVGIVIRGGYSGSDAAYAEQHWNGGHTIAYNVFERIGDVYNNVCLELGREHCLRADSVPVDDVTCWWRDEVCFGYAGVNGISARYNTIEHNVFSYIESADSAVWDQGSSRKLAHGVYLRKFSNFNTVRSNYVTHSSGAALKLRDRSDGNRFVGNYLTFSGQDAFISNTHLGDDEVPGLDNEVEDNVMLLGYPHRDSARWRSAYVVPPYVVSDEWDYGRHRFIEKGTHFHEGRRAEYERIGGMALGDVDGDGKSELFVARNYPALGVSLVVRSDAEQGRGRHLSRPVYWSKEWDVNGLAVGEFDAGAPGQLISNLHKVEGGVNWTELWRGSGAGPGGAQDVRRVYRNDNWIVTALAAGNFDGSGGDELLSAFKSDGGTRRIYRGTATGIGSHIYETPLWDVLAMTALRASAQATQDTLYTSFKRPTSSGYEARLYSGNGVTSVTSGGYFESVTNRYFPSLAARSSQFVFVPSRLFSTVAYDDGHASLFAYNADGSPVDEIDAATSGQFTHAVYGRVAGLSPAPITAHQRVTNVLYPISQTEIRSTNGVVFHTFVPAPPCNPAKWDCD